MTKRLKELIEHLASTMMVMLLLCLSNMAMAQTGTNVNGLVTDQQGNPLIGVSILKNGSKGGTISDLNGRFSIAAGSNDYLDFSYIGYKSQHIAVKGRTTINVTMQ